FDAHLVVTRLMAGIADRIPRVDRALALDGAGTRENCFKQGSLAALERAHQRNTPGTRNSCAVLCHSPPPIPTEMRPSSRPFEPSFQAGGGFGKRRGCLNQPGGARYGCGAHSSG